MGIEYVLVLKDKQSVMAWTGWDKRVIAVFMDVFQPLAASQSEIWRKMNIFGVAQSKSVRQRLVQPTKYIFIFLQNNK